ncbi:hypothetical protein RvY_10234-2 [Ramazzottius varieornatus]|uniref:S-methyl-5-thioribose-1-phosphate isomerase n=1 Tax=Ramazzottius varieornatus TaxID=947166 RepID=A0A1D1VC45_RAMVA|nr:hypothetical protein RvY_10234-2 [Ramazzottius varieornatus]
MTLKAIRYSQGRLEVLDQLLLPAKTEYVPIDTVQDGWNAIKSMQVRGAPAIAIVGCLSLAVELYRKQFASVRNLVEFCVNSLDFLVTARPTAVNIRTAADQLRGISTSLLEQNEISVDSAKDNQGDREHVDEGRSRQHCHRGLRSCRHDAEVPQESTEHPYSLQHGISCHSRIWNCSR